MTLPALFLAVLGTATACYRHDPLYCDVTADCADVPGRPFCDSTGEHPASDGIARTCIPDPAIGGPDAGMPAIGVTATALPHLQIGSSLAIEVHIERPPGSDGAVELTVPSPPPGLSVAPLAIPSSASAGVLTVTAAADALHRRLRRHPHRPGRGRPRHRRRPRHPRHLLRRRGRGARPGLADCAADTGNRP
jgi:hypothetical protein